MNLGRKHILAKKIMDSKLIREIYSEFILNSRNRDCIHIEKIMDSKKIRETDSEFNVNSRKDNMFIVFAQKR